MGASSAMGSAKGKQTTTTIPLIGFIPAELRNQQNNSLHSLSLGGLCPPQAAWGSAKGRERNERELVKLNEAERIEEINSLSFGW